MSIWILLAALCVVFVAIGFFSGAIRTSMMLLGIMLATMVDGALAPKLTGLMPKIGIKHPIWIQFSPYIFVFALLALVFFGIGFAIHYKIQKIYETTRDDFSRLKWVRMNRNVGASLGIVISLVLLFTISKVAYIGGYLTAQVEDDSNSASNPGWIKFLSKVRTDLQGTGLDKAVAALDKTNPYFYDASDVIGLIYHNPNLQPRVANYPPFLTLGQRQEFQDISTDKEYNDLIFGKQAFGSIINHANTQRFLANQDVLAEFRNIDLKDLLAYLKTGKSKYDDEKILGRWILDKDSILTHVRKTQPDLKGNDLMALKRGLAMIPDLTLINMLENKSLVKAEGGGAPAADPNQPAAPAPDPNVPERYRQAMQQNRRGPAQAPAATRAAAPATATPPPVLQIAGEGTWKQGAAGQYELALNDAAGKPQTLTATIMDDELTLSKGNLALVFIRAE